METIDSLYAGSIQLVQARKGYRFSLDPVLLAHFASLPTAGPVLDLGCGCGILALLIARRRADQRVLGWERQPAMVRRAQRSAVLSGLAARVEIVEADLRQYRNLVASESFGLVVANPPYRTPGSGRIGPDDERAAARFELFGALADFIAAAAFVLRPRGHFALVYLAERLTELLAEMSRAGLAPKRLRMIHARPTEGAKMVLVEGCKGAAAGLVIKPPLFVYQPQARSRAYSAEVLALYAAAPSAPV